MPLVETAGFEWESTHFQDAAISGFLGTFNKDFMGKYFSCVAVALQIGASVASGALLDSNFSAATFANVGSSLTGMAWAPDGSNRLFITKKEGSIVIVENGTPLATPFATVSPLFTDVECGLIGIC